MNLLGKLYLVVFVVVLVGLTKEDEVCNEDG